MHSQMNEVAQRAAMPAPAMRRRPAVTVVAPGEGPLDPYLSTEEPPTTGALKPRKRQGRTPPVDVVMRDTSRDDDEQDPDAASSSSRRKLKSTVSVASQPDREPEPDNGGGGSSGGGSRSLHMNCRR